MGIGYGCGTDGIKVSGAGGGGALASMNPTATMFVSHHPGKLVKNKKKN